MACNLPNKINPTFIGIKQAPLSCEEYDNNLRILLQRSNHEGSQSYITICDFNEGIELSDSYNNLQSQITNNTSAVQNLESLLSAGGSINNELNNLQANLQSQINNVVSVNNTQNNKISNLESSFSNILDFIASLGNLDLNPLTVRVTNLETITSNHSNSIAQLTAQDTLIRNDVFASVNQLDTSLRNDIATLELGIRGDVQASDQKLLYLINKLKKEISSSSSDSIPVGSIFNYAGNTAPENYLLCQGQILNVSEYPKLYEAINTIYGTATEGTFKLPDLRSKVPVGNNNEDFLLGQVGGEKEHVLTIFEMPTHGHTIPQHTHVINDPGHSHTLDPKLHGTFGSGGQELVNNASSNLGSLMTSNVTTNISIEGIDLIANDTGSNTPHNNMQPFIVLNYIIKVR